MMLAASYHSLTIYIPDSPILLFFMVFVVLFIAFKITTYLIKAIPFL